MSTREVFPGMWETCVFYRSQKYRDNTLDYQMDADYMDESLVIGTYDCGGDAIEGHLKYMRHFKSSHLEMHEY